MHIRLAPGQYSALIEDSKPFYAATVVIALIVVCFDVVAALTIPFSTYSVFMWTTSGLAVACIYLLGQRVALGLFLGTVLFCSIYKSQVEMLAFHHAVAAAIVCGSLMTFQSLVIAGAFDTRSPKPRALITKKSLLHLCMWGIPVCMLTAFLSIQASQLFNQDETGRASAFTLLAAYNFIQIITYAPMLLATVSISTIALRSQHHHKLFLVISLWALSLINALWPSYWPIMAACLIGWIVLKTFQKPGYILAGTALLSVSQPLIFSYSHTLKSQGIILILWIVICFIVVLLSTKSALVKQKEAQLKALAKQAAHPVDIQDDRAWTDVTASPIVMLDCEHKIIQWNSGAEALLGYERDTVRGLNFADHFIPESAKAEIKWKLDAMLSSQTANEHIEIQMIDQNGETHAILWNIDLSPGREGDESKPELLLIGQNISDIRETQNQLHFLAHFDALTGTANRRLFEDRVQQALQSSQRHQHHVALICLDIDHFKRLNDTYGHDIGDNLLETFADRLKQCIRKEDTVARLGGDEFAILLVTVNGREGAERAARNIRQTILEPYHLKSGEIQITSSIGITLAPNDGDEYIQLLKNADMAMYRAKNSGRNNIHFYSPEMNEEMQRQVSIEHGLRMAIKQEQFRVQYQPIINIESSHVVAVEALIRWEHPNKGLLDPEAFLDVAEQTGLIMEIGKIGLETALRELSDLCQNKAQRLTFALNLSPKQFKHPHVLEHILHILKGTPYLPKDIILEIAESSLAEDLDHASEKLKHFKQAGFLIALDSFGTGLSSLSVLKQMPIDIIKIDRSFVDGIPDDENDLAIAETLLAVAEQMDLKTFAIGVENRSQEAFLKVNGCKHSQGSLYAEPQDIHRLDQVVSDIEAGTLQDEGKQIYLPFEK